MAARRWTWCPSWSPRATGWSSSRTTTTAAPGIVLGWETDSAGWERAVATALASPYIVQERVAIPSEPYPSLVDGRAVFADRMMDTAPFVCHGDYVEGCLTRLSTAALLNVTAGGGSTIPTFVVERR